MKTLTLGAGKNPQFSRRPVALLGNLKSNYSHLSWGQFWWKTAKNHVSFKMAFTDSTWQEPQYLHEYLTKSGFLNSLVLHWGLAVGWVAAADSRNSGWRLWRTCHKLSAHRCTQKYWNFSIFQNFENQYLRAYWTKTGSEGVPELEIS